MKKLKCHKISEPWQVELMRCIYNDNIDSLSTHPLPFRNYFEQQEWWNNNKDQIEAYLYEPYDKPGKFVAFLSLRKRGGFCTPTIAIQRDEWGGGYGQEIVHDYIDKANGPIAGTQLQSNEAICHINKKVGWQVIGESGSGNLKIDLLFHPGINPENKCDRETFSHILEYLGINPEEFDYNKVDIK